MQSSNKMLWNGYTHFPDYPFFIQLAIVVILISFAFTTTTICAIILKRIADARSHAKFIKAQRLVTTELTHGALLGGQLEQKKFSWILGRLDRIAKKGNHYRQMIADELIFYHRNLTDATGQLMYLLFKRLHLTEGALQKLKKGAWNIKAKGLREIQEMPPATENLNQIMPFLNSPNNDLRIEAQAAYLKLSKDTPFAFLDDVKYDLLPWHQIILLDVIANDNELPIPSFKIWLKSPNSTVITFCIKLILEYQQFDAIQELIGLLKHPIEQVKLDAIEALGKLYAEEAEPKLIDLYASSNVVTKKRIVEAISTINTGKYLSFLESEFLLESDFGLLKAIGCALVKQAKFEKGSFIGDGNKLSPLQQTVFKHCSNELIRN